MENIVSTSTKPTKRKKLPVIGNKINISSHPDEEEDEIKELINRQKHIIDEKRIEASKSLIIAEWDDEIKEAKVVKNSGSALTVFGHTRQDIYLFPEEILFLIEMNNLELYFNGVRMSVQRSYSLLINLSTGVSIEQFRVFKHFCIHGYKVFRHNENKKDDNQHKPPYKIVLANTTEKSSNPKFENFCKKLQYFDKITDVNNYANLPNIIYDVYDPSSKFPKSNRPDPEYYIVMVSSKDQMMDLLQFVTVTKYSNILFAAVSENSISVFNLLETQIPELFDEVK